MVEAKNKTKKTEKAVGTKTRMKSKASELSEKEKKASVVKKKTVDKKTIKKVRKKTVAKPKTVRAVRKKTAEKIPVKRKCKEKTEVVQKDAVKLQSELKHDIDVEEKKVQIQDELIHPEAEQVKEKTGEKLPVDDAHAAILQEIHAEEKAAKPEDISTEEVVQEAPVKTKIYVNEFITVKDLSQKLNIKVNELIKKLMSIGIMATINQRLDLEIVKLTAAEYGCEVEVVPLYGEELLVDNNAPSGNLVPRFPVVTIMGHVDHGKTSLLDSIRESNIIAKETGGITQHIGAYKVTTPKGDIVFLDTPGHEAFTSMRARGSQVTDLVILVVAADDGVMPQTVEAVNHARAAGVSVIVAINKIDLPGADVQKVKQGLSKHGLIPEEWGGKTVCVEVSAKTKAGIDNLLEMILLEAELLELKANPDCKAFGTVIEAKLDKRKGNVATLLVQRGTLREGDVLVSGMAYGKIKAMLDDYGKRVKNAGPATPVEILGISSLPHAGDRFQVVATESQARHISEMRQTIKREEELQKRQRITLEDLHKQVLDGKIKELKIIIKADVQGSVEAVKDSLERLSTSEVKIKVIHSGVGGITDSDVILAVASNALIISFNVKASVSAERLAIREKVDIRTYRIIYEVIEDMHLALEGMLEPEYKELSLGRAQVREVFKVSRVGTIAGSIVIDGKITQNARIRLIRDNIIVYEGSIVSLRRFKDDVKEVSAGNECGIGLENFSDIKTGDVLEAFIKERIMRKLTSEFI